MHECSVHMDHDHVKRPSGNTSILFGPRETDTLSVGGGGRAQA